jgi:hypothetical protein
MRPRLRPSRRLRLIAKYYSRDALIRQWQRSIERLEKYDRAEPDAFDWYVYDLIPFYGLRDEVESLVPRMTKDESAALALADSHFLAMTQDDTEHLVTGFIGEMEDWLPTDEYRPAADRWWYLRVPRRGVVLELLRGDAEHAEPTFWDKAYLVWQRHGEEIEECDSGVPSSAHVQLRVNALATPRDFIETLRNPQTIEMVKLQLVQQFHSASRPETVFAIEADWFRWLAARNGFVDIDQYVDFDPSDDWPDPHEDELQFSRAGVAWEHVRETSTEMAESQLHALLSEPARGAVIEIWQRFQRGYPATTGLGIDVAAVRRLADAGVSVRIRQTLEETLS